MSRQGRAGDPVLWEVPPGAIPIGAEAIPGEVFPRAPKPVSGARAGGGGSGRTVDATIGREVRSMVFARRSRWFTDPRGTPKPAEPGRMVRRGGAPSAGLAARPRPT